MWHLASCILVLLKLYVLEVVRILYLHENPRVSIAQSVIWLTTYWTIGVRLLTGTLGFLLFAIPALVLRMNTLGSFARIKTVWAWGSSLIVSMEWFKGKQDVLELPGYCEEENVELRIISFTTEIRTCVSGQFWQNAREYRCNYNYIFPISDLH